MRAGAASVRGLLIAAMAVWGLNLTVVKLLTAAFDPMLMACLRMIVACAGFALIVRWRRDFCCLDAITECGSGVVCGDSVWII